MKRTVMMVLAIVALGVASQSCESSSNLEDIVVDNEEMSSNDIDGKEDEKSKPGSN
ncbi:MAG: hypothetical protein Tsb0034_23590 [Ekhidna sp.]